MSSASHLLLVRILFIISTCLLNHASLSYINQQLSTVYYALSALSDLKSNLLHPQLQVSKRQTRLAPQATE